MNREIKFNAWNKQTKTMHYFINSPDNWSFSFLNQEVFDWLQYTGLKDKKGVEIYEGDVCKIADPYEENEKTFTVEYSNGGFAVEWHSMFCGGEADMTTIGWAIDSEFSIEVIGNIYQNPDLLQ